MEVNKKDFIDGMRLKDFVHPLDDWNTLIEVWSSDNFNEPIYRGTIFKCPQHLLYKYIDLITLAHISNNIIIVRINLHNKVSNMGWFVPAMSVEGYLETFRNNTLIEVRQQEIKYNKITDTYETHRKMLFKGKKFNCPGYLLDRLLDFHHHPGIGENTLRMWVQKP